jgi:hypothetical protein
MQVFLGGESGRNCSALIDNYTTIEFASGFKIILGVGNSHEKGRGDI